MVLCLDGSLWAGAGFFAWEVLLTALWDGSEVAAGRLVVAGLDCTGYELRNTSADCCADFAGVLGFTSLPLDLFLTPRIITKKNM